MKFISSISAFTIAFAATTAVSTNAHALSCRAQGFSLQEQYNENKASNKKVIYVLGNFSLNQKKTKKKKPNFRGTTIKRVPLSGKPTVASAFFSGQKLTKAGAKPFKTNLTVKFSCAGPWCGKLPNKATRTIAILQKDKSGYSINVGPCTPNTFSDNLNSNWTQLKSQIR